MIASREYFDSLASADRIYEILKLAVHAPSTHNSQPWLFEVKDNIIRVMIDPQRLLPIGDPSGRYAHISIGTLVGFFTIIAKYYGVYSSHRIIEPDERNALIEIVLREKVQHTEEDLLGHVQAIEKRFNARGPFLPQPIPWDVCNYLASQTEGSSSACLLRTAEGIERVAALTEEGMQRAHKNKLFRNELTRWIRNNYSKKPDGIPGYTMLAPGLVSLFLPYVLRWFNLGTILGKLNGKGIRSSPLLAVIGSKTESKTAWLETGILFARCSLFSIARGVYPSIFVAAIDQADLRKELARAFNTDLLPEFFFALGKPKVQLRQSPRIPPNLRYVPVQSKLSH